jgi:hypothetical protein
MTQSKNNLNILSTILKLSVSLGLVYWTYHRGLWNFDYVAKYLEEPFTLISGFTILCITLVLIAQRWKNILSHFSQEAKNTKLISYVKIVWISCLFNSFLPGSIAGDLLRFRYKSHLGSDIKTSTTLLSTLLDRVIALMVVLLFAGLAPWVLDLKSFVHSKILAESLELMKLLSLIPLFFYFALALPKKSFEKGLSKFSFLKEKHLTTLLKFHALRKTVVINTLISLFIQSLLMTLFLWWGFDLWKGIEQAILLISMTALSFVFIAIPISPAGAGVGHVVFETLYREVGLSQGANLFNLYFLINFSINLLGIIPFLLTKADGKSPAPKP